MKVCKNCGKEFVGEHNRQMYCSRSCTREARTRAEMRRRKRMDNIKLCAWCGKPLDDSLYRHYKYCSDQCKKSAAKERRHVRKPPKKEQPCWTCQKYINGCSWSRDRIPVNGWIAEESPRVHRGKVIGVDYRIHYCPQYISDN